jgi:phage gpG-like protein
MAMSKFLTLKAKEKFGTYQHEWAQLAEATQIDRGLKGFPINEPLLRTGELRDSIKFTVENGRAIVGSTSDIMVYQELGTASTGWSNKGIPPRPVFKLTWLQDGEEARKIFSRMVGESLLGK